MQEASFASTSPVSVRFHGYGRSGVVRCYYGVTPGPAESGFPALRGWAKASRAAVGFPTIKCEVESDRPGYWSIFGWIQWVTQDFSRKRKAVRLVDRLPAFLDRDLPFATMGYAPAFFDAPAYLSLPAIDFQATLFLCTLPMMSHREAISPLAGFNWGYRIAKRGDAPTSYPLETASNGDWRRVRTEVARLHTKWRFTMNYQRTSTVTKPGFRTRPCRGNPPIPNTEPDGSHRTSRP